MIHINSAVRSKWREVLTFTRSVETKKNSSNSSKFRSPKNKIKYNDLREVGVTSLNIVYFS